MRISHLNRTVTVEGKRFAVSVAMTSHELHNLKVEYDKTLFKYLESKQWIHPELSKAEGKNVHLTQFWFRALRPLSPLQRTVIGFFNPNDGMYDVSQYFWVSVFPKFKGELYEQDAD